MLKIDMPDSAYSSSHLKSDDDLKLLHLMWEDSDHLVGGMGVAGGALCEALKNKVQVQVVSPREPANNRLENFNTYQLDIGIDDALKLQKGVENQQNLDGIMGAVADFARQVSEAQHSDPESISCSLVHAHDWMTAAAGVCVQRCQGVPLILHVHSTQIDREGAHAKGGVYQHEKWAMQQADIIIAVSDYTKRVIIKHYDISSDKISVVKNASVGDEVIDAIETRSEKKPMILFAGRLVTQKSPELAVEILVGVLKKMKSARAVIAGGGEKLRVIREVVKFKNMDDRIEVLGNLPKENMRAVYRAASVLIMPSISEPFGLVATEAANAGVAVIMSDRCGASEVLKSARVIELGEVNVWIDHVLELLENRDLREAQVCDQRHDIAGYTWGDAGESVLKIVETFIKK